MRLIYMMVIEGDETILAFKDKQAVIADLHPHYNCDVYEVDLDGFNCRSKSIDPIFGMLGGEVWGDLC